MEGSTVQSTARGLVVIMVGLLALASCGTSDRAFDADERIRIVSPRSLQTVSPPFVLRWTGDVSGASAYVVFIDRPPMAPNVSLREYVDEQCKDTTLCPAEGAAALVTWLEQHGIFKAKPSKLKVPFITARGASTEKDTRDTHEAILVVLGDDGRRLGESAWTVSFRVPPQEFGE
jgi:hypothetical protein